MMKSVLILGQTPDPHIEAVAGHLRRLGASPLLVDHVRPWRTCRVYYSHHGNEVSVSVQVDGQRVHAQDLAGLWCRMKPVALDAPPDGAGATGAFVRREWRSVLASLEHFTPVERWLNPRASDLRARNKPSQLAVAQQVGLRVPRTLISNDPDAVAEFLGAGGGEHIYKPLSWYARPPDTFVFTSVVTAADVASDPDAVTVAPGIFQERIPKAFELRVTIVADRVFAAKVDSQRHQEAQLDWRRWQTEIAYSPCQLPPDVTARLMALHHTFGLVYGAYDLIVTPDGEHVFLEVNPVGQWLWIEEATGMPIAEEVARVLASE